MKSCITISLVEEARGGPFVLWDGLEQSIAFAGELGYDAVEIFAPSVEAIDPDSLGNMLDRAGLKLAALGTGRSRWVLAIQVISSVGSNSMTHVPMCR